ncbi:ribosome recycling factor [Lactifluus subvellereus]|nr:ribosome recycling factor [Lactifluus subvellereus]
MSLLLRHRLRLFPTPATSRRPSLTAVAAATTLQQRPYASKKSKHKPQYHAQGNNSNNSADAEKQLVPQGTKRAPIATASLTPGSRQAVADPAAREELARAEARMAAGVEWLRREVAQLEARASGRVTPRLLAPVRVAEDATAADKVRLEDLATVGVRDGSSLIVTVFDPQNLKRVQDALYEAKIQGVIPQRVDERTLRIPIPKPTVEARLAAYSTASKLAEDARVQIRRQHQASVKKGKYAKHSIEHDEFQKLQARYIAEVDTVLAQIRKSTGAR